VQRGGPSTGLPTKTERRICFRRCMAKWRVPVAIIAPSRRRIVLRGHRGVHDCDKIDDAGDSAERWDISPTARSRGWFRMFPSCRDRHSRQSDKVKMRRALCLICETRMERVRGRFGDAGIGTSHRRAGEAGCDGERFVRSAESEHMVRLRAAKIANIKPAGEAYIWTGPKKGDRC